MIPAKDINIDINQPVNVGDVTMFNIGGKMRAVEITDIDGCMLTVMTCDLELVWRNVSLTTWLKQVEFLKQFENV